MPPAVATVRRHVDGEDWPTKCWPSKSGPDEAQGSGRLPRPAVRWSARNRPAGGGSRSCCRLAADLAAKPEAPAEPSGKPDAADLLAKMPESVRAEARTLLDAPNLMQRVVEDIGALGVAGEKELAATVYLVGTSRLLPEPTGGDRARPNILGQELRCETGGKSVSARGGHNGDTVDAASPVLHAARKPGSSIHRGGRAEPAGK